MMDGMRRLLLVALLVTLVVGCMGAGLVPAPTPGATDVTTATATTSPGTTSPGPGATVHPAATPSPNPQPTPEATTIAATAGTASTGPGVTIKPSATIKPDRTPGPSPNPTPLASVPPLDWPVLRYRLVDELGRPLFCDPDFYPIARLDEAILARQHIAAIRADAPTYTAIVAHLGIAQAAALSPSQVLAIYREWKMLRALLLTAADGGLSFDYIAAAGSSEDTGWRVVRRSTRAARSLLRVAIRRVHRRARSASPEEHASRHPMVSARWRTYGWARRSGPPMRPANASREG